MTKRIAYFIPVQLQTHGLNADKQKHLNFNAVVMEELLVIISQNMNSKCLKGKHLKYVTEKDMQQNNKTIKRSSLDIFIADRFY